MHDVSFDAAFEDFVTRRIDDLNTDSPDGVTDSITEVGRCMTLLKAAVPAEHSDLFDELEDALSAQVGEEMRYFYRSGFADATRYILKALNIDPPGIGTERGE